ncbi:Uncharacterised protein [Vibrio cholerae]|nr:Uncharacterised protein [Vibrio cholerae]
MQHNKQHQNAEIKAAHHRNNATDRREHRFSQLMEHVFDWAAALADPA